MTTQFEIDCALMAGASYISTRPDINKFPIPAGWATIPNSHFNDPSTGFEAVAFQSQCSNDIIISRGKCVENARGKWGRSPITQPRYELTLR